MTKREARLTAMATAYTTIRETLDIGWPNEGYATEEERLMLVAAFQQIVDELERRSLGPRYKTPVTAACDRVLSVLEKYNPRRTRSKKAGPK